MKKLATLALSAALPFVALAGGPLGTKPDLQTGVQSPPTQIIGTWDVIQMVLALVVVFALLKWGLPFVFSKFGRKITPGLDNTIRSLESAPFGGGSLQVVEVRDRTLLLSVTSSGASLVCDLTQDTAKAARTEPKAFFELLDEKQEEPTRAPTHAVVDFGFEDEEPVRNKDFEAAKQLLSAAKSRLDTPDADDASPSDGRQDRVREALDRLSRLTG